ncbi:hypothetical protein CHUAL_001367 [Chamberlinius hualienensis]
MAETTFGKKQKSPTPPDGNLKTLWQPMDSLDEDMEKLFESAETLSISQVMAASTSSAEPEGHKYCETDYQLHRGESFPHVHQPLKSIHSRSMRRRLSRHSESDTSTPTLDEKLHHNNSNNSTPTPTEVPSSKSFSHFRSPVEEAGSPPSVVSDMSDGSSQQNVGFSVGEDEVKESATENRSRWPEYDEQKGTEPEEHEHEHDVANPSAAEEVPLLPAEPARSVASMAKIRKNDASELFNERKSSGEMSPDSLGNVKGRVKFEVGSEGPDEAEEDEPEEKTFHRRYRHRLHRKHVREENPLERQCSGTEMNNERGPDRMPTEPEEAQLLKEGDLDLMTSHRFEDVRGLRRHKIQAKSAVSSFIHVPNKEGNFKQMNNIPVTKKIYDRRPHETFVELDELLLGDGELEWKETARWIKYEEDLEVGSDRWGKPHVGPLSFHSLLNLRKCLEQGTVLLDLEEKELPGIAYRVVEHMVINDQIKLEDKAAVMRALLLRHRHVNEHRNFQFGLRRNASGYNSLLSLADNNSKPLKSVSFSIPHNDISAIDAAIKAAKEKNKTEIDLTRNIVSPAIPPHVEIDIRDNDSSHYTGSIDSQEDLWRNVDMSIMKKIPEGAEATTVLVGGVDFLEQPTIAFVRLAEGIVLPTLLEVPVPVRFMFILLGPTQCQLDYHEIGRSISTLMSNRSFHEAAYKADDGKDLLRAINEFLDDSIVLPPGDWHDQSLLPIHEIQKKTEEIHQRKHKVKEKIAMIAEEEHKKPFDDPLQRTRKPFGGLVRDIKRRMPWYKSDIMDAVSLQCLSATIFIYFAALSGAISFGGILSNKTQNLIGVTETLICSAFCGVLFSLLSGQPLMIIGVTGPVLLFDESLFSFCQSYDIEFLPMRIWIGGWLVVIALVVVAVEGSFFLRYFTRFTEDILSALISIIYIYEAVTKLIQVFEEHPLISTYCYIGEDSLVNVTSNVSTVGTTMAEVPTSEYLHSSMVPTTSFVHLIPNYTLAHENGSFTIYPTVANTRHTPIKNQPNTALLTMILMFGTFFIAFFLRQFRNGHYLGRTARRALGDFGVPIAIAVMVSLDYCVQDTYTEKLNIPQTISPSDPAREWFVHPMGTTTRLAIWQIFAAFLPAMLFFILLFMEVQICELIMKKAERRLKKGSGFHLDILLMCLLNLLSSLVGGPWMSAAIVRAISHVMSLTVMSQTHAPGDKPHILEVKDQRLTNLFVSLLVGVSVFMTSVLKLIPVSVLFGIFIYMGVVSMSGVQFFERLRLFLMPVKHHPQVSFVQRVKTWRMHLFTIIQLLCFLLLWIVKSSPAAIALPFVLLLMIPLRSQLVHVFSREELKALDSSGNETKMEADEPDFYEEAPMPG